MNEAAITVGYIPKAFPRISETFVSNEIVELERLGLDLRIYTLVKSRDGEMQPSARRVRAPIYHVPERVLVSLPRLLLGHLLLLWRRPRAYFKCLRWMLWSMVRGRSRTTAKRFLQAGFLAGWVLRNSSIRHYHAHFCHGPATVALFLKWMTGSTFSFTAHAKDLWLARPEVLREKMREAEFVLTCTDFNRRYLEGIGGDVARVHRVYHGIDLRQFTPALEAQPVPAGVGGVPTVLSVGRLVAKKGHDTLIRACGLLRDQGVRFRCAIYGSGPELARLEVLARSLRLEGVVELRGPIMQDELVHEYEGADVFALACQVQNNGDRDGLPNVLIEAQAMGLPVVSTEVSAIPELIEDGVNGLLVPQRAPELLAGAIGRLLQDPALRRRLGASGRQRVVTSFDVRRNTQRVFELLLEACGAAPSRDRPPATSVVVSDPGSVERTTTEVR